MNNKTKAFLVGFVIGLGVLTFATSALSHPPDEQCVKLSQLSINIAKARDKGVGPDEVLNYFLDNVEMNDDQVGFMVWLVTGIYEEGRDLKPYEIGGIVFNACEGDQ